MLNAPCHLHYLIEIHIRADSVGLDPQCRAQSKIFQSCRPYKLRGSGLFSNDMSTCVSRHSSSGDANTIRLVNSIKHS